MSEERRKWANERATRQRSTQRAFDFMASQLENGEPFSLRNVDAELLHQAVSAWTDRGYLISFGRTSDGGAMGFHLTAAGDKRSKYFSDVASAENFLSEVVAASNTQ